MKAWLHTSVLVITLPFMALVAAVGIRSSGVVLLRPTGSPPLMPGSDAALDRFVQEPSPEQKAIIERWTNKRAAVDALMRGEQTLAETAARFRELNSGSQAMNRLRARYPDVSDDELCHRQVIDFVRGTIDVDGTELRTLIQQLEQETVRRFSAPAANPGNRSCSIPAVPGQGRTCVLRLGE